MAEPGTGNGARRLSAIEHCSDTTTQRTAIHIMKRDDILGTWLIVQSEIPEPYKVEREIWHFSAAGMHIQEFPFDRVQPKEFHFRYEVSDNGFSIKGGKEDVWRPLEASLSNGTLFVTGAHGYRSRLRRMAREEVTGQLWGLLYFYEPSGHRADL